jgi:hypothetical protein
MNIRRLQETLGHAHIETTMRYFRLTLPRDLVSPLDRMGSTFHPDALEPDTVGELFEQDLALEPLVAQDTWSDASRALYGALKTQLGRSNFLANRANHLEPD